MRTPPSDDLSGLLGRLYDEHATGLFRYALMVLADHAAAEDAVQEVFAGVATLQQVPDAPAAYLRAAVRNACFSRLRRRQRLREEEPLLEVVDGSPTNIAEKLAVEAALRTLAPEQREVVHLHVFEGWTLREVAEMTETSINTVASRYRYALAHLRGVLARAGEPDVSGASTPRRSTS